MLSERAVGLPLHSLSLFPDILSADFTTAWEGMMAPQSCVNRMKRAENTTLGYPGVQNEGG